MVGEGSKWRWIFIDFNNNRVALFRPTPQIGRGIDDAEGPNRKENVALFRSCDGRFEFIGRQHFAKPNNVRPQISAARSTSAIFDIEVITRTIVFETEEAVKISVELDQSSAAGARVQAIDILSDEQKLRRAFLDFDQSQMSRIRFCFECLLTPPPVPIPD